MLSRWRCSIREEEEAQGRLMGHDYEYGSLFAGAGGDMTDVSKHVTASAGWSAGTEWS